MSSSLPDVKTRAGLYGFEFRDVDRRRAPEGERKTYEAKQLWQRHHEIVNLSVRGFKNVEIAEILGIDPQTVSNVLNSQLGMEKTSEIRLERDDETKVIVERVRKLTEKAVQVYEDAFNNNNGELSLKDKIKVADTVMLELSGMRVPTKIQSQSIHTTLTRDEIEEFKSRGIQAARASGLIVDVVPEEANGTDGKTS